MYDYHYDHQWQTWHVFNGGAYVCTFPTSKEAREFCEFANADAKQDALSDPRTDLVRGAICQP